MSAKYDLYETPDPKKSGEQKPLHARLVPTGKLTAKELCARAANGTTFSYAEVSATLKCLTDTVLQAFGEGKVVELGEIGTLSLSLQCRPVMEKDEIRSASVHVRSLTLRPSKQIKRRLRTIHLERNPYGWQTKEIDADMLEEKLTAFFAENPVMRSPDYCRLRLCKRCKGVRELNELVAEGKLVRNGKAGATVYLAAKGYFGR